SVNHADYSSSGHKSLDDFASFEFVSLYLESITYRHKVGVCPLVAKDDPEASSVEFCSCRVCGGLWPTLTEHNSFGSDQTCQVIERDLKGTHPEPPAWHGRLYGSNGIERFFAEIQEHYFVTHAAIELESLAHHPNRMR